MTFAEPIRSASGTCQWSRCRCQKAWRTLQSVLDWLAAHDTGMGLCMLQTSITESHDKWVTSTFDTASEFMGTAKVPELAQSDNPLPMPLIA